MPQASDSTAWMAVFLSLAVGIGVVLVSVLVSVVAVALAAVAQHLLDRRSRRRPYWHTGALAVAFVGLLTASMGASLGVVGASVAGAVFGAWRVRGCNLTRHPRLVAMLGSGMGLAVMLGGFARDLFSSAQANVERVELYAVVFIGALIFAISAIAWCKLRGALPLKAQARPGHSIVNLFAVLLCGWLGYGFVTEHAQPFGLAALLAMSALAFAIGVHLMISREYSSAHNEDRASNMHGFGARCDGVTMDGKRGLVARIEWHGGEEQAWTLREIAPDSVRAAAYRHCRQRRDWHDSRSGDEHQRVCVRHRPAHCTTRR